MRALVLTLVAFVAWAQSTPAPRFRRFTTRTEQGRNTRGLLADSFAFFEFAPASGAGMGVAGAAPNWVIQSEALESGSWADSSTPVALTRTADFAAAPNGTLTAERIQYPAVTAPAQYARFLQIVSIPAGPITCSVYLRGNGTSGTLPIYLLTGFPANAAACAFDSSNWSRCSVTATNTTGSENFYIGPSGVGTATTPAQDVLAWGAMCNAGSTAAPYIKTTTVAAGYRPTGAKGEALTFTRSGTAFATKTASGGLATTGIANGDLVLMPGDTPRVEYDSQGVLGLRVESARTNSALRSQEVSDAIWVKAAAGTGTIPTVTADFATAPDGTTTADRVQFSSCATVGSYSAFSANITTTSPTTSSVYMRAASGTPTVSVCPFNFGTSLGTCSQVTLSTSSWTRFDVPNFAWTTNFNLEIGCENRTASYTGATNSGAADVLVWGIQAEAGAYATSYIPTTTAAVTRNAETPSFASITGNEVVSAGSAAASATVSWPGASGTGGLLWESATGRYLHFNGSSVRTFDGTNEPAVAHGLTAGSAKRFASTWSGATFSVLNVSDATSNTLAFDGSMTAGTALFVGYSSSNGWIDGVVSRACLDPSPARCR